MKSITLKNNINAKWIAKGILTIILLIFMWAAFPGYGFHTWFLSTTASHRSVTTEVLSDSVLATQYFTPVLPYLRSIQFAVDFEEQFEGEENATFSLCEESGKEIFSREISIADMESSLYYEVEIDKRLKTGRVYYWSITSPMDSSYDWKIMYTEYPEDQAPENTQFLVGDNLYGGVEAQTISQYVYYDHHDKIVIIGGFWACGILFYIVCLEIIDRIFKMRSKAE